MKNCLAEKQLDQVRESIRICKLNIENQEKKLRGLNKKITMIESKIVSIDSLASNEFKKLINVKSKLMIYANLQKEITLELRGELDLNETKLQQ